jgi:hypothetical protein
VNFNPPDTSGNPSATRVRITDSTGVLATNVAAVRFTFDQPAAPEAGYTGYTEIDVFGTAVPEPASLGLAGVAAIGLLTRRCRRAGRARAPEFSSQHLRELSVQPPFGREPRLLVSSL